MKALKQILMSLTCSALVCAQVVKAETLTFAVVPQQSAKQLAQVWQPIFNEIYDQTGVKLLFSTAPTIPEFQQRLSEGEYDFAYMNPYHYTVYSANEGYRAFAKSANKKIKGIVVTHKNSPYQTLADLDNLEVAFPAPLAFAATVLPTSHLKNNGVSFKPFYVRTHDSVYLNVSQQIFAAGGGIYRTFNNMPDSVKSELRILWESPGYTPHAFTSHPRINSETLERVQLAFINLENSEKGQALLKKIGFTGIEAAVDADWDDVRSLNIKEE